MEIFAFDLNLFLFDLLIPCALAVVFGGAIGLQRERADRAAGLRTHSLVCLGATVFALVSFLYASANGGFDPFRIAASVVTGIGFIGAGAIFRQGSLVKGVTTASSIWISAAIGISLGMRLFYLALLTTVLGFLILSIGKFFEDRVLKIHKYSLSITANYHFKEIEAILDLVKGKNNKIIFHRYELNEAESQVILNYTVLTKEKDYASNILRSLREIQEVQRVVIL
jgi:putative Mg2+ transporter-C (MgtC) family protein